MSWDTKKDQILKDCYGKGKTASQIAEIIGNVTRNAVIGRASRLGLSGGVKIKSREDIFSKKNTNIDKKATNVSRRTKFRNLVLDKNFEAEKPKSLEELTEDTCKWPIGHPNEKNFYFCGRKPEEDFPYCKLHVLYAFQPKGQKEDVLEKDDEVPEFIEKKVKVSSG